MTPASPADWYLGLGDQRCTFCLQRYSVEVEVHCGRCDGPLCPHCVLEVTERRVRLCPDCGELEVETSRSRVPVRIGERAGSVDARSASGRTPDAPGEGAG